MNKCKHEETKTINERCFTGPVAAEENRRAHGGVTQTEECVRCGSRRDVNVNWTHIEEGPWGPSREQRRLAALAARSRVPAAPSPITLRRGPETARVSVDADGYLVIETPAGHDANTARSIAAALPEAYLAAAKKVRAAVSSAAALEAEIA